MAVPEVRSLLEKVTEIQKRYPGLLYPDLYPVLLYPDLLNNELQKLKIQLVLFEAILADSAQKSIEEMKRQSREVVYDVEDTLDTFFTAENAKKLNSLVLKLTQLTRIRVAKQIKSLTQDKMKPIVKEFAYMLKQFSGSSSDEESKWRSYPGTRLAIIRDRKFVGREDDEKTITNYLKEPTTELDVISIVGMDGLGKTTLAWKIYNSDEIKTEFPIRIWFNISEEFNRKDLFLNILKEITGEEMSGLSNYELDNAVKECLEREKFFIVLDDLWSVDDWNSIKYALPLSNGIGKIMITSRITNVGVHASVRGPHNLRFLTIEESWKLLQLEAFADMDVCLEEFEAMGEEIVHISSGVPLAIILIGGILKAQLTRQGSARLSRDEVGEVLRRVTRLTHDVDNYITILDLLKLSYDRLPDDMRDCFLYVGVFPEDYEIPAWKLIRLWVAEGFIQHREGQSLEETAEGILNDLINMNLLMFGETNTMGKVKTCRVLDLIRYFCLSKAVEQNLFQEIKSSRGGIIDYWANDQMRKYRRICYRSDLQGFLSRKPKGPRVRSFLGFRTENAGKHYISAISDAFRLLRVLESISIRCHQFPAKLTKLILLKYVTLYVEDLTILPDSISHLTNLQTLVVETNSRTLTIKANIWRMIQLRHLKTKAAAIVLSQDRGGAAHENIQTLSTLSVESCTETVSNRARDIKELGIRGNLSTLFGTEFLKKLLLLEKLKLVNELATESRLPQPDCFPPNLKRLTLTKTFLNWSHMSTLAKIDTLEVLKLKENAFTGTTWDAVGDGFSCLQFLLIADTDLVTWEASTNHFPTLTCLSLKNCDRLTEIPQELATKLQKLEIECLCTSAVDSARKIEKQKELEQGHQKGRRGIGFKLTVGPLCVPSPIDQAHH